MTVMMLAILLGAAGDPQGQPAGDGISLAKRLTAAIKGQAEFRDGDFVRPLEGADRTALRRFAACPVKEITYTLKPDPTERDAYVTNTDGVLVRFGCERVPSSTPVGLSLHLQGGKIVTIETHNADLMRDQ